MVQACNSVAARILVAYLVGFLLALGPFDHVVVSPLHLLFGIWLSDAVAWVDLWRNLGLATAGNMIGGPLLITFTHTAQVKSWRRPGRTAGARAAQRPSTRRAAESQGPCSVRPAPGATVGS